MNRTQPVSGRDVMDLRVHIRQIPDFPKPGILFYDISTLLQLSDAFQVAIDRMADLVAPYRPARLIGIESRGFVFAAPLALRLGVGLTMVRKRGKLPGSVAGYAYNSRVWQRHDRGLGRPDPGREPCGCRRRPDRDRRNGRGNG